MLSISLLDTSISTHTLTWSVTMHDMLQEVFNRISTHTLTWSVTPRCNDVALVLYISTHTLTWSVTITLKIVLS